MSSQYTIWDEIRRMQQQMDAMFEQLFGKEPYSLYGLQPRTELLEGPEASKGALVASGYRRPASDIYETEKEVIADIEMPGLDKKDIKVRIDKDYLEVKAEKKAEVRQENKKEGTYRLERSHAGFYRCFALPSYVDAEKATASYKDGVLRVTVPKLAGDGAKRKLIEVK